MMDWLAQWRAKGVVLGPSSDLLTPEQWTALQADARVRQTDRFARYQAALETRDRPDAKRFLKQWLGRFPVYEPTSVWASIAQTLQPIASAYLQAPAVLRFYNLWETLVRPEPASRSQLWHKDPEDRVIAKAFLYLSDVTEGAGPLTYATGTHAYGPHAGKTPEQYREAGSGWLRSTDAQMAAIVPQDEWTIATGPAGTLVLADTAGYHKGGQSTTTPRWLATWEFTTPAGVMAPRFHQVGPQP